MTDLAEGPPSDPTAARIWAEGIWQDRASWVGVVSGDIILRRAAAILGEPRRQQIEAYIQRHGPRWEE